MSDVIRKPLSTKNASSDTVPPGTTASVGIGTMTSMCETRTMITVAPRKPSKESTRPTLRGGSTGGALTSGPDVDVKALSSVVTRPAPF